MFLGQVDQFMVQEVSTSFVGGGPYRVEFLALGVELVCSMVSSWEVNGRGGLILVEKVYRCFLMTYRSYGGGSFPFCVLFELVHRPLTFVKVTTVWVGMSFRCRRPGTVYVFVWPDWFLFVRLGGGATWATSFRGSFDISYEVYATSSVSSFSTIDKNDDHGAFSPTNGTDGRLTLGSFGGSKEKVSGSVPAVGPE